MPIGRGSARSATWRSRRLLSAAAPLACSDLDRIRLRAQLGGADSQLALAYRYGTGNGVEKNEEVAFRW